MSLVSTWKKGVFTLVPSDNHSQVLCFRVPSVNIASEFVIFEGLNVCRFQSLSNYILRVHSS